MTCVVFCTEKNKKGESEYGWNPGWEEALPGLFFFTGCCPTFVGAWRGIMTPNSWGILRQIVCNQSQIRPRLPNHCGLAIWGQKVWLPELTWVILNYSSIYPLNFILYIRTTLILFVSFIHFFIYFKLLPAIVLLLWWPFCLFCRTERGKPKHMLWHSCTDISS